MSRKSQGRARSLLTQCYDRMYPNCMLGRVRVQWFVILVGVLTLNACGSISLQRESAGQTGCQPAEITISNDSSGGGSRTWTATCRGRDYSCSASAGAGSRLDCTPMDSGSGYIGIHGDSAAPARMPANVRRDFDEAQGVAYVRGTFGVASRLQVVVMGAPSVEMGTLAVSLVGPSPMSLVRSCQSLELLINAEPTATERNEVIATGSNLRIESRFPLEVFRPLAARFPEFGVRACGTTWRFTPEQVTELQKLLVMYSDMATELQNDADTNVQPAAGQTTL